MDGALHLTRSLLQAVIALRATTPYGRSLQSGDVHLRHSADRLTTAPRQVPVA
jgi:hypothetical protein